MVCFLVRVKLSVNCFVHNTLFHLHSGKTSQIRRWSLPLICVICIFTSITVTIPRYYHKLEFGVKNSSSYFSSCRHSSTIIGNRILFDNGSHWIHHYPEFICPQNFRNLADWIYGWPENIFNESIESSVNNKHHAVPDLPDGSIIYIKTDGIPSFFESVYPHLQNKFVLITGQSDISMPGRYLDFLEKPDSKIIHWFGQNGDINASRTERFTHIPIGKDIWCTIYLLQVLL